MPTARRNSVFFNFSSLGLIQVANFFLSLAVIPYVIKIVGAEGFGIIAVAQVLMFYLSGIADYGFDRTASKSIVLNRGDKEKISRVFYTVLFSKLLLCLAGFLLLLILVAVVPLFRQHWELYLLAYSFVIGQALLMNWFFQGMEKMHYMAVLNLLARLLFVAFVFIFFKQKEDLRLYLLFMGLGNLVAGLLSIYIIIRFWKLNFHRPSASDLKLELKNGWHITVSNLSQISIQYIGIFILRLFTNDVVVGYYSIAERVYFALKLMIIIFLQSVYPRVCLLLQNGIEPVVTFFKKSFIPFLSLVIAGSGLTFLFAPEIIHFFMNEYNADSVFLLRLLTIALPIVCLHIPPTLVLLAGNHNKSYFQVFTAGTFINIATNLVFVPIWGSTGTVLSVILTELLIMLYLYWETFRLYGKNKMEERLKGQDITIK